MFWRRRNEGFEWREYVRTTKLVRRKRRREQLEHAGAAAVFGVRQAGRRGAGAAATGMAALTVFARRAGATLWSALLWSGAAAGVAAGRAAHGAARGARAGAARARTVVAPLATRLVRGLGQSLAPAVRALGQPTLQLATLLIGASAALATAARVQAHGTDTQALISGAVAAVAGLVLLVPLLFASDLWRRAWQASGKTLAFAHKPVLAVLGIGLVAGAGLWIAGRIGTSPTLPISQLFSGPLFAGMPPVEGSAVALTGDSLRIGSTIVRLNGIEAPELDQRCARPSVQRWRCGEAAQEALARLVRRKRVTCAVSRGNTATETSGDCETGGVDLAAELVAEGHVFAETGLLAKYGREEAAARAARAGLWAGEADRPSDFRAKRWAEAQAKAPDGCPIKGRVRSGNRIYVLPWSGSYDNVKVRSSRGERWFCSEADAQAAGFRPTEPS